MTVRWVEGLRKVLKVLEAMYLTMMMSSERLPF